MCDDRLHYEILVSKKADSVAQNRQGDNSDASDLRSGRCGWVGSVGVCGIG